MTDLSNTPNQRIAHALERLATAAEQHIEIERETLKKLDGLVAESRLHHDILVNHECRMMKIETGDTP
jgi:hypothetical protein